MIIDCHTHLGRNEHIKSTVKQLLKSMDTAKVDKAMVFAGELNDCPNEWMLEQIKPHRDRLLGVMAYDQFSFHFLDFKHMAEDNQVAAIKFYTGYDHYYPYDLYEDKGDRTPSTLYHNPLQICSDLQIPAIFHMGDCLNSVKKAKLKYAHPLLLDEVAVDYDDVTFIIAHMGFPWVRDAAEVCYKNANVYSDFSGFVYKEFDKSSLVKFQKNVREFLEIADSSKLLFGTDWPIASQASYLEALDWLAVHTADKEESKVLNAENLSKNIKKAFKLP